MEPIIQDCRVYVVSFTSFHLSHVKRGGNNVAHTLAAKASEYPQHVLVG